MKEISQHAGGNQFTSEAGACSRRSWKWQHAGWLTHKMHTLLNIKFNQFDCDRNRFCNYNSCLHVRTLALRSKFIIHDRRGGERGDVYLLKVIVLLLKVIHYRYWRSGVTNWVRTGVWNPDYNTGSPPRTTACCVSNELSKPNECVNCSRQHRVGKNKIVSTEDPICYNVFGSQWTYKGGVCGIRSEHRKYKTYDDCNEYISSCLWTNTRTFKNIVGPKILSPTRPLSLVVRRLVGTTLNSSLMSAVPPCIPSIIWLLNSKCDLPLSFSPYE